MQRALFFSLHLHHARVLRGDPFGFRCHLVLFQSQAFNCRTDGPEVGIPGDATGTMTACQRRACEKPPSQQFDYGAHFRALEDRRLLRPLIRQGTFCQVDRFWWRRAAGGEVGLSGSLLMCACVCSSGEFSLSVTYRLFTGAAVNHVICPKLPEALTVLMQENSARITSAIKMTYFFTI